MALLLLKPIAAVCDQAARACCPEDRPSPVFLGFTVLLNVPVGAYAVVVGARHAASPGCATRLPEFLFVMAAVNAFMVFFAVYLYRKFSRPYSRGNPSDSGPWARASDICLNDPWAAVFIIVAIFAAIWANLGLTWARAAQGCGNAGLTQAVRLVGSLTNVFLLVGAGIVVFSLCIESCRHQDDQHRGMFGNFFGSSQDLGSNSGASLGRQHGSERSYRGGHGSQHLIGVARLAAMSLFGVPEASQPPRRNSGRPDFARDPAPYAEYGAPRASENGTQRGREEPPPYTARSSAPQRASMTRTADPNNVVMGIPVGGTQPPPCEVAQEKGSLLENLAGGPPSAPPLPAPQAFDGDSTSRPPSERRQEGGSQAAESGSSSGRDERLQQAKEKAKEATKQAAGAAQKQALMAMKGVGKAMSKLGKALEEQASSNSKTKTDPSKRSRPSNGGSGSMKE